MKFVKTLLVIRICNDMPNSLCYDKKKSILKKEVFVVKTYWKKMIGVLLLFVLLLPTAVQGVAFAAPSEQATLPTFKVRLNGEEYHSERSKYPLFVYRGITYLPATYFTMRYMGISTEYRDGILYLKDAEIAAVAASFDDYSTQERNPERISVKRSKTRLKIGEEEVAVSKYPLMSFREVLYLPMSWDLIHDRLGMSYSYTETEGLQIRSSSALSAAGGSSDELRASGRVDEHFNPLDGPGAYPISDGRKIYRYEGRKIKATDMQGKQEELLYDFSKFPEDMVSVESFEIRRGHLSVRVRVGTSSLMSTSYLLSWDEKGNLFEQSFDGGILQKTADGVYQYAYPASDRGGLIFHRDGKKISIGNNAYRYGDGQNLSDGYKLDSFGEYKDKIYLMAQKDQGMNIVSVDKRTHKTETVVDLDVRGFVMDKYMIYFWDTKGIYFYNIDYVDTSDTLHLAPGTYKLYCRMDRVKEVFPNKTMTPFFIRDGILMATAGSEQGSKINGDAKVIACRYDGTTHPTFVCTFKDSKSGHRIWFSDERSWQGKSSSDPAVSVSIVGNQAHYYNLKTKKITTIDLSDIR